MAGYCGKKIENKDITDTYNNPPCLEPGIPDGEGKIKGLQTNACNEAKNDVDPNPTVENIVGLQSKHEIWKTGDSEGNQQISNTDSESSSVEDAEECIDLDDFKIDGKFKRIKDNVFLVKLRTKSRIMKETNKDELEALQKLKDIPSVPKLYRFEEVDNRTVRIWIEYFEGRQLLQMYEKIKYLEKIKSPLFLQFLALMYNSIQGSLQEIHAKDVTHGDLHLGNIIVAPNKNKREIEFKIVDFGLTKTKGKAWDRHAVFRLFFEFIDSGAKFDNEKDKTNLEDAVLELNIYFHTGSSNISDDEQKYIMSFVYEYMQNDSRPMEITVDQEKLYSYFFESSEQNDPVNSESSDSSESSTSSDASSSDETSDKDEEQNNESFEILQIR